VVSCGEESLIGGGEEEEGAASEGGGGLVAEEEEEEGGLLEEEGAGEERGCRRRRARGRGGGGGGARARGGGRDIAARSSLPRGSSLREGGPLPRALLAAEAEELPGREHSQVEAVPFQLLLLWGGDGAVHACKLGERDQQHRGRPERPTAQREVQRGCAADGPDLFSLSSSRWRVLLLQRLLCPASVFSTSFCAAASCF